MNQNKAYRIKKSAIQCLAGLYTALAAGAAWPVTDLDLADVPLYLEGIIEPNIVLTLDNSGSMAWGYMPDDLEEDFDPIVVNGQNGGRVYARALAPDNNKLAYNPSVTYMPPSGPFGDPLPDTSFHAAWDDGYAAYLGNPTCTVDLRDGYRVEWGGHWASLLSGGSPCDSQIDAYWNGSQFVYEWMYPPGTADGSNASLGTRAYYYLFYANHFDEAVSSARPVGCPSDTSLQPTDDACYVRVNVDGTSGPSSRPDERQNFANWYSYYRNRMYSARAGLSLAFGEQGTGLRVGYGQLNHPNYSSNPLAHTTDGESSFTVVRGVRKFEDQAGTHSNRSDFFDWLFSAMPGRGGTPLRRAADDVGQYFERSDAQGPWSSTPGANGGTDFECRQSYHILTSDGYWSEGPEYDAITSGAQKDTEAQAGSEYVNDTTGDTWGYKPKAPFTDSADETLADVAMYYWKRDLRTDLLNKVPATPDLTDPDETDNGSGDPAFWQHLTTFTLGLGVEGGISRDDAFEAIASASMIDWKDPLDYDKLSLEQRQRAKIDDMLHAAVNGRGDFFSASDPADFSNALESVLGTISGRKSSSSSVALSSFSLFNGGRVYQATFDTGSWGGNLEAYNITEFTDANGNRAISLTQAWQAAAQMPAPNSRRIFTADAGGGVPFRWNSLGATERTLLDPDAESNGDSDSDLLRYIRGEKVDGFRKRVRLGAGQSPLGDIINSTPAFVGAPRLPYPDSWPAGSPENNGQKYSDFRIANENRPNLIVTGGNDGMLHVFDEENGIELFAYIPSVLLDDLDELGNTAYDHRYYVDGPPTVLDAYFGSSWHTMAVGGLNGGGQAVYALDITQVPASGTGESTFAGKLKWEFTDADDPDHDLGYTFSRPNIVRMANGEWAAVFGNGYNNTEADGNASATGNAALYIVRLSDGALIKKIDTGVGYEDDPLERSRPNGLSTVTPIDVNGDFIIDYIYGGDLFGNLWRFDVNSASPADWKRAYINPLFKARASTGDASTAQPIYVRPQVVRHPGGEPGVFVLFGTGKFFEVDDKNLVDNPATQTVEPNTQTFYAIWDRFEPSGSQSLFTRNHLLEQEILREITRTGGEFRETSDRGMSWYRGTGLPTSPATDGYLGWYMDLYNKENGNTNNKGERVVFDALVFGRSVLFATMTPSENPCDFGGSGWIMELSIEEGARPPYPAFDVNGDGTLSFDNDTTSGDESGNFLSGTRSKQGIPNGVSIGRFGSGENQKFYSDSLGGLNTEEGYDDLQRYFRQSWRRLQ